MKWLFSSIFGVIGVTLLLVACPLLAVSALLYAVVSAPPQEWVLVNGTVTGMVERESYDSDSGYSTTYCPAVEYTTTDGQTVEIDLNECSSPPMYSTGDAVEVYYNPANPESARLKGGVMEVVGTVFVVVLGAIGGLMCLAGGGLMLFALVAALWRTKTPNSN